jgi:hypothetical protein
VITLHASDWHRKNVALDLISMWRYDRGVLQRGLFFAIAVMVAGAAVAHAQAPSAQATTPLSVEEVVRQSQAGISEELIITRIKKNGKAFDLSTEELVELKKAGVSDNVIKFLLDPAPPYTPPPPPAPPSSTPASPRPDPPATPPPPSAPPKKYPDDPHASKVPWEPGLYRFVDNVPLKVDIKMLLGAKEGPGLGKVLMKKGKVVAYLVGPASKVRSVEPSPVFYMRLAEGKEIDELVLVACDRKDDRREIDMGPPGPKPEFKPEALRPFDLLEVGLRLFKITPSRLTRGEYLFFLTASAEPAKGTYGKGYDFGIDEPPRARK